MKFIISSGNQEDFNKSRDPRIPTPAGIKKKARWSKRKDVISERLSAFNSLKFKAKNKSIIPTMLPGRGRWKIFLNNSPPKQNNITKPNCRKSFIISTPWAYRPYMNIVYCIMFRNKNLGLSMVMKWEIS